MARLLSALDVLNDPALVAESPLVIVFGDDAFLASETVRTLQNRLLAGDDSEFSLTVFDGGIDFPNVLRELSTRAMFGSETRVVRVADADRFASNFGPDLEDYLDKPSKSATLILSMSVCAANTRLYKKTSEKGLLIDARSPTAAQLSPWLVRRARSNHQMKLSSDAAAALLDLIGPEPGLLENEMARLALSVPSGETVSAEQVRERVGAWRLRKVWDMIDAFLAGQAAEGLRQLDLLLASGENPVAILAQSAATLRRFAAATRLFIEAEQTGKRVNLAQILQEAQIPPFAVKKSAEQMIQLGRARGDALLDRLLETDIALKGGSRSDGRLILEHFFIELAHPALKKRK